MSYVAEIADRFLEHAMRRRIGDHCSREVFSVGFGFLAKIFDIDVAALVRRDDDDLQAAHGCRRRVGAVGGSRNKTYVAMFLAPALVIGTDRKKSRILSLRA